MRQARLRSLILALAASSAALAGCGGGGEKHMPEAGADAPRDVAQGEGGVTDGAPRDGAIAQSAHAGIEAPGKPIGSSCAMGAECASGFCADGVCCNTACTGTCVTCAGQGTVGTCVNAQLGTDPRDQCPVEEASTCGSTGM